MADKVDIKKVLAGYRAKQGRIDLIDLPPRRYLMIDGHGDPNTSTRYRESLETLYPLAYALKFASARQLQRDYAVPPLEALWWAEDMESFTRLRDKNAWQWTVMILTPDWIEPEFVHETRDTVARTKSPPHIDEVRLETLEEGLCVQTLHVGPYDDEGPVLDHMRTEFIPSQGLTMTGRHHEIYLSDPRRVAQDKLRTILRQPVSRVTEGDSDVPE